MSRRTKESFLFEVIYINGELIGLAESADYILLTGEQNPLNVRAFYIEPGGLYELDFPDTVEVFRQGLYVPIAVTLRKEDSAGRRDII